MQNNFLKALKFTLSWEGGFVHDPKDPGGATKQGVTQGVYNAYRLQNGRDPQPVENIQDLEVVDLYKKNYWDKLGCNDLPNGLDIAAFDFAVNSGVGRVLSYLTSHPTTTVKDLLDYREGFVRKINNDRFLRGWLNRINALRDYVATFKGEA